MRKMLYACLICFTQFVNGQSGSLDVTFGVTGMVFKDVTAGEDDVIRAIAIQPDGKIVAAGYTSNGLANQFAVVRYNGNGTPDISFDTDGTIITPFSSTALASALVLQPDGKIVVAGHTWGGSNNEFALVRYNADGSMDTGFGNAGFVQTGFASKSGIIRSMILQPDGKLIVGGFCYQIGIDNDDFALARYNPDGSIDSTFGTNGIVITNFTANSRDNICALALQTDGKIVATGFSDAEGAIVRYHSAGNLDLSFGTNGKLTMLTGGQTVYNALQIVNGQIVVAGISNDTLNNFVVARYNSNGTTDGSFGSSGVVVSNISNGNDGANALTIQPDGKLLACGTSQNGSVFDFAIVRYLTDGTPDATFGTNGVVKTVLGNGYSVINSAAIQADGKLVVGGYKGDFPNDFVLARYITDDLAGVEGQNIIRDMKLFPNPLSGTEITVEYSLATAGLVTINLLDNTARLVAEISMNRREVGKFSTSVQLPSNLSAGSYFLHLSTGTGNAVLPLIITDNN